MMSGELRILKLEALHAARSEGSAYSFYREGMSTNTATRLALEHRLRGALDHRPGHRIVGVEALLRWWVDTLQQLRAAGVRVAIDDFKTGFSSLSRLADLPIDILEIDCSFVRRLTPERASHAIVSTIIALARSYGLETVAIEALLRASPGAALEEESHGYAH